MEESDRQFLEKRLADILKYRDELEPVFEFSDQEIKKDNLKKKIQRAVSTSQGNQ